jgi:hypothetical protein
LDERYCVKVIYILRRGRSAGVVPVVRVKVKVKVRMWCRW